MNPSPDVKIVNKATFIGGKINSAGAKEANKDGSPLESPRNLRYQSVNEFEQFSDGIDRHLEQIRAIQEASASSKASQARNQALQ